MERSFEEIRGQGAALPRRPRVYFEEWDDPMIGGIGWIGEMIEIAGGQEIFPEYRPRRAATERIVDGDLVVERDPEIILASWCGKHVDIEAIRSRPGWDRISASRNGRIFAVEDELFLSPGPALSEGIRTLHSLIAQAV
jgi:iron complex transport system substrate-binding protein